MTINENTILASVASDLIRKSFNTVMNGASNHIKLAWGKVFEDFKPFMEEAFNRNSNVRILCKKDSDVNLYDVYVSSDFRCGDEVVTDEELMMNITDGKNIIINGNGGAGKTFFMRHLWLSLFKGDSGITPIFLELRQINDLTNVNLETFIRHSLTQKGNLEEGLFAYFCSNGKFAFLFDGFDEVVRHQRDALQRQILKMAAQYPRCRFVISSRYEKRFAGWQGFDIYESRPFSLEQVKNLIENVPFNIESKKLFLKKLNKDFYNANRSFLSNPLLAIMMMMTFKENMDIPTKMSSFYDQAFNTLYQWHDATKAFNREKSLDISELRKSFGMFCLLSYYKQVHEFSKTELVSFIEKSHGACGIKIPHDETLADYEEAVNLIRQDGLNYVFIHRSFQEYFAAYALVMICPDKIQSFIPAIKSRTSDNVIGMCFEMQRSLIVNNYIDPIFKSIMKKKLVFLRKNVKKYQSFIDYKISYMFHMRPDLNNKGEFTCGIGVKYDSEFVDFFENIYRLKSSKPSNMLGYTRDYLIDHELFDVFNGMKIRTLNVKEFEIIIEFRNEMIEFVFEENEIDQDTKSILSAEISKHIERNSTIFNNVNNKFQIFINDIAKWCKAEIEDSNTRSKSIDEILKD